MGTDIEAIAKDVVDAAYKVHKEFGPELVDGLVIVENKTVESIQPIHMAQLITYLKLKGCKLGFLINWNEKLIKNGIQRVVNGLEEPPTRAGFIKKP